MSFLAIDVGNTRVKWAHYTAAVPGGKLLAHGAEFLENIDRLPEGNWAALARPGRMLGCVVAADAVRRRVEEHLAELWDLPAQWVVPGTCEAGLTNGYDHPGRLGADRWVAMIGAWHRVLAAGGRISLPGVATNIVGFPFLKMSFSSFPLDVPPKIT